MILTRLSRAVVFRLMRLRNRLSHLVGLDRGLALLLLTALIVIRIWDPMPVEELRLKVFDAYQVLRPRQSTARPVAILDIDEPSLRTLGQWPWSRRRMAEIVLKLKAMGVVAVGFDIVFAEPDRLSPRQFSEAQANLDPTLRVALEAMPSNDDDFASAIKQTRVILGRTALSEPLGPVAGLPSTGFATLGPNVWPYLLHYPGLLANIPVLEAAARGRGLFTIAPERDGIVRRVPMVVGAQNTMQPSLTLDIMRVLTGAGAVLIRSDGNGILDIKLPGFTLATDPQGQIWVHFTTHDPSRFVSAADLLADKVARGRLTGRVVLIGTSAIGLLDNKTTPISRSMPGVEVQAQVLESLLANKLLYQPNFSEAIELLTALGAALAIIGLAPQLGPLLLLGLGAFVAVVVGAASWWSYRVHGALVDATFPLTASFIIYSALAFLNYFKEQVGRRRIRSAFSQYLSPDLVSELSRSSNRLTLGGETRTMSIMFSDVRGFTGISESFKGDPQGLTSLMNRFLTPLTNAIIDHKGTIDKYMGDAIMAFWNAPLRDPLHERNACDAALDMLARLQDLNQVLELEQPPRALDVGIGVNTGECVVGNMGSDLRFDYSVLGDSVNLASRLEGQSKSYGIKIILGDATAMAVGDLFAVLEIDLLQVKGKNEPEAVWTLIGDDNVKASDAFRELAPLHAAMIAAYRAAAFDEAEAMLDRCAAIEHGFGLDRLYELYRERLAIYRLMPPPPDWRGVYVALTK